MRRAFVSWVLSSGPIGAIAFAVCAPAGMRADDGPPRFHDVTAWRGTLVAGVRANESDLPMTVPGLTVTYNCVMTAEFLLDEYEAEPSVWRGKVTSSNLDSYYRSKIAAPGVVMTSDFGTSGPMQFEPGVQAELQFHRERGWSFHLQNARRSAEVRQATTMTVTGQTFRESQISMIYGLDNTQTHPYPAKGLLLFHSEGEAECCNVTSSPLVAVYPHKKFEYTIYLEPASMDELRLEIEEPPGYQNWRPQTTLDASAGEPLVVTARVVSASGKKISTAVERFIWQLRDTSFEPGVTMNYPIDSFDARRDLELAADGQFFELDEKKQRVERAVREGWSDTVKVVPFDWGGWSTLEVTAIMADGRRIKGKLKGKSEFDLRVPKRDPDSHIADGWKASRKSGADSLDDESEPVGDGNPGDGYTLWEEYRGWIIEGEHVEGDPEAKDFFVLNHHGPDGDAGIALFEALSEFRVHTTTRDEEMNPQTRQMNPNVVEGAHVVDQHGVVLGKASNASELAGKEATVFGAMTYPIKNTPEKTSFRPATTQIIGILPLGHPESLFSQPGNLSAGDAAFTYERAIAHELMHSVGVIEHGTGDGQIAFSFIAPTRPENAAGRPYFALDGKPREPLELRDEDGHDIAASVYPRYEQERARWLADNRWYWVGNPGEPGYPRGSESEFQRMSHLMIEGAFGLSGQVGSTRGQHSGAEDCIMRYHFATFYPMTDGQEGFYRIAPGAERAGFNLCDSQAGTGVNDSEREPQSRHGAAHDGAGNCAGQICPNDLYPPRATPF